MIQKARIQAWADSHGVKIGRWFTELNESGGKMDRPKLAKILARIQKGETGGIAVAALDRFSRTNRGALETIDLIEKAGGVLVAVQEGIEPGRDTELTQGMSLVLADWQHKRYSAGWKRSRASFVERGIHHGTSAPFGYDRTRKATTRKLIEGWSPTPTQT